VIPLAVLWIAWCILHSVLISRTAHTTAERILGRRFLLYRFLYVTFSAVSLIPVLWYQFTLPEQVLLSASWTLRAGQTILVLYACFMFYAGARVYDMGYFLGLSQWRSYLKRKATGSMPFHTDGILAMVRHPWYSAGIALLWGVGNITDVYLLTRVILTGYFLAGTFHEESRLKKELGEPYIAYCRHVPMLLPWKIFSGRR